MQNCLPDAFSPFLSNLIFRYTSKRTTKLIYEDALTTTIFRVCGIIKIIKSGDVRLDYENSLRQGLYV